MKRWAVLTVALYGVILLLLSLPLILVAGFDYNHQQGWQQTLEQVSELYTHWGFWLWLGVMLAGQALLLLLPLEATRERPVRRRRLWLPVVTGGFFLGNLVLAGVASLLCALFRDMGLIFIEWPAETSKGLAENLPPLKAALTSLGLRPDEGFFYLITTVVWVGIFWAVWGLIFHRYARADAPETLLKRLTRWLLRGSALELIVAVPSHIIVRQRGDCCAPLATFWGIVLGFSIMLLSFGPGVFFLFVERMRRLKAQSSKFKAQEKLQ